jgi:hypothetical protein
VQCLSREASDEVVEDAVLEALRVAVERGYV